MSRIDGRNVFISQARAFEGTAPLLWEFTLQDLLAPKSSRSSIPKNRNISFTNAYGVATKSSKKPTYKFSRGITSKYYLTGYPV
mgnify:CR=1 FL=1